MFQAYVIISEPDWIIHFSGAAAYSSRASSYYVQSVNHHAPPSSPFLVPSTVVISLAAHNTIYFVLLLVLPKSMVLCRIAPLRLRDSHSNSAATKFVYAVPSPRNRTLTFLPFSPMARTICGSSGIKSMAWSLHFTSSPSTSIINPFTGFSADNSMDSPSEHIVTFRPRSLTAGNFMNLNGSGLESGQHGKQDVRSDQWLTN